MKYDPHAELATRWLPELAQLTVEQKHQPWLYDGSSENGNTGKGEMGGMSYCSPIISVASQLTKADQNEMSK